MQYQPNEDDATDSDVSILSPDDIRDYNPDQILPQSAKTVKKIRAWLKPTPYDVVGGEFRRHLLSHAPGTGDWLTSSATYQDWLHGQDHGLLWIRGIPGSGKSVMAAWLADELAKLNPDCPVLYFFFRQIIDANHEPQAMLRDWMDQILKYSPPLQNQLLKYVNDGRTTKSISMEDMWGDLRAALSSLPGKLFCIADALDEMDQDNDAFLQALGSLGQFMPAKVKVLITSRPVPSVEGPLRKTSGLHVRLQDNLVDIDIANYVDQMLAKSAIPERDWRVIREAVPGRANGLFLYAKLAMDAFLELGADVKSVIGQLPVDLNALYTDLLNEHAKRSGIEPRVQHLILQAVTHATRPLRLLELTDLVMVANPDENARNVKDTKSLIRAACGPLLEILADETVSVIHHSFTEYLKGTTRTQDSSGYPVLSIGSTHTQLALACLHYLQSGCLDSQNAGDDGSSDESTQRMQSRLKHPFLEYAAQNWYHHARQSDNAGHSQTEINVQIHNFLSLEGKIRNWLPMRSYELPKDLGSYLHLHVPAKIGLISYFREALANDVPASQDHRKSALRRAAEAGHASIVQELIAAGTDPDQDDAAGLKPLHYAAEKNHHEVVKALLEAGVNPLTPKTKNESWSGCTPPPCTVGDTPSYVEIKLRALGWASGAGRSQIVTTILQDPRLDINAKSGGTTPLYRACSNPDASVIKSLLLAGADPNIHCQPVNNSGFAVHISALDHISRPEDLGLDSTQAYVSAFAHQKHPSGVELSRVFPLLKQAGADFHKRDYKGRTLLHLAVQSPLLTGALLDSGVDANLKDENGETPLHNDDIEVDCMTLLIDKGHADINATRNDGKSVLLSYLSSYKSRAHQRLGNLFTYGPDCNVVDKEGNGPLHVLLNDSSPSLDTIEELLRRGADVNLRNYKGQTPLILSKETKYLEMLLSQGASFKTQDFKARSLLHEYVKCHTWRERTESFTYLLGQGLDIHAVDKDGNNLLHELALTEDGQCSYHGKEAIRFWEQLVEMGVDSDLKNYAGRTPLHLLCAGQFKMGYVKHQDITVFDFVLPRVKNVDVADNDGVTPLHIAATGSERYSTRLIAAGADPSRHTNEGLTPLHIATRCRASNIVGRLLDALRAKDRVENSAYSSGLDNGSEQLKPVMGVNEQTFGRETRFTPLFYACRSGTPETVRLLLDAGATVDLRQMLDATLQFEEECALWRTPCQPSTCDDVPVKLYSRLRRKRTDTRGSWFYHLIPEQMARLDEIWVMIVSHLANVSDMMLDAVRECILKASLAGQDYTASILSEVRRKWQSKTFEMLEMVEGNINSQKQSQVKTLKLSGTVTPGRAEKGQMNYHLSRREYHLVEEMAHLGCLFLPVPGESDENCLSCLVGNGYSSLFEKVAESVAASVLPSGLWHAYGDNTKPGLWFAAKDVSESRVRGSNAKPLIVAAVQRGLPNMAILQLLVERFGVDINELHYNRYLVAADSVLHSLAQSTSWWHTQQALPYLIKAESNREVAISLIEAGADVNAADNEDKNCLSYAQADADISQLLRARGANTSVNEIFAAIDESNVEALKRILSRNEPGINANSRRERSSDEDADRGKRKRRRRKPHEDDSDEEKDIVLDDQLFPLFYAGVLPTNRREDADKTVKVLLDFNANPFAKFLAKFSVRRSKAYDRTYDTPSIEVPEGYRECTLAHELFLRHRGRYENLVLLPALDVNHRDCKGRTLLHVSCIPCWGPDSIIKSEQGDDASLFERLSFSHVLETCPELFHQADDDGRTPLLEAAIYAARTKETKPFNSLLEAGADCLTVDKNGESCLHKLAENLLTQGLRDHFKDLVKRGVDINGVNSSGETPLFAFSRRPRNFFSTKRYFEMKWYGDKYSEKDALPLLLRLGADLTVANNKGQGLLHAAASGDVDRFKEVMEAGADVMMEDEAQQTALDIAAASDNQEVLALFEKKS
uniref:NACHT domain-containing protein n=1 Tax=Bionectria ochroleuca TaxID=29856 RepID=A0A8H7NB50_BIOOC